VTLLLTTGHSDLTELSHLAYWAPAAGLEPATSRLTIARFCQLSYAGMSVQRFAVQSGPGALTVFVAQTGVEPASPGL
jgi:hypothetical protein